MNMANVNITVVTEFILLAFEDLNQIYILFFIILLLIYNICVIGNIIIFLLITFNLSLHTPMYFLIRTFTILEILFVSVIIPKFLDILIAAHNRISFVSCFIQFYCAASSGVIECYLLAVMVIDRYLAITNPLHYSTIISQAFTKLALFPWVIGFTSCSVPTVFTAHLDFCGPNVINHFFCDVAPLQHLACSKSDVSNLVTSTTSIFVVLFPFIIIIGFYTRIIITVSKIKSAEGKHKAFSTCSSHLIVTSLFFGTAIIVYVRPNGSQYDKFLALMYTVVTPLLNPFIYTLRNKDVKTILFKSITLFMNPAKKKGKQ